MNIKDIHGIAENLFSKRSLLMNLWQEIAENFYPERADFTLQREVGDEFADNLYTSFPIIARRDLGNAFSTMLRPTSKEWFHMGIMRSDLLDNESRQWLEFATNVMRRAMYDRVSNFTRATKEGDHDFAAFGQAVISVQLNQNRDALLYRAWHLRDVVWSENTEGKVGCVYRKWKPSARELMRLFPGKVHEKVKLAAEKDPFFELDCRHFVIESDMYDGNWKTPYVSIYYDVQNNHVVEAVGVYNTIYVVPRWQTVAGSQYAYSPATIAALPDARLVQAMTRTLLEAGEKLTNPPMVAVQEAIRSDISIYAGGITWVDRDYDERLGEVLRPLTQDAKGMPIGIDMQRDCRQIIAEALFLSKLNLPQRASGMSEYEVGERVQEYIRNAMPLFEPVEMDYNGGICELTFDVMMRAGAFGSPQNMPRTLMGMDINFTFESPLHDAIEHQKGRKWMEAKQIIADAVALDPSTALLVDAKTALRDILTGMRVPAKWQRSESTVKEMELMQAQARQAQELLATMQQGADVGKTMSEAGLNINQAQQVAA